MLLGHGSFKLLVEDMVRLSAIAKEENPEEPFIHLAYSVESPRNNTFSVD
jgi:hypothetical protein